jgi:hypothetical protein
VQFERRTEASALKKMGVRRGSMAGAAWAERFKYGF